ncbi:S66 peptidase family protein [Sporanaerobacter sp. PP17-6a]|uniref:S66 peptidase family protein n=1 Tax=Sporanaerobacter sp. PP17-6a TaxID=1891289 RepID=UPI00089FD00A|nr:LD-carboxypeptidase [Sporanaerobacter sp. PP17-6a]SCL86869.1 putative murein peptide carboxypeptidase [Sporanaerobacter sp. PP17-6a]
MIKPKALKVGDTIGVISPSGPTSRENVEKAHDVLMKMGFKVKMGKSVYEHYGYLSGRDEIRAEDINNMFSDDEIDAIICMRGGYGASRILDMIEYDKIRNNPKIFVGYSDITLLHIVFNQICGLVTFHGPMVSSDMIENFSDFSRKSLFNFISEKNPEKKIKNPGDEKIETFSMGVCEGEITGGNLSLITATLGTPYEINTKGKILFLEDVNEEPYSIDKMLTQLKLSGKFSDAAGLILGDWNNCTPKSHEYSNSLTLEQIFEDIIKPLKKPVIKNLKSGHCKPKITIPFGVKARLDASKGELYILENTVE